MRHFVMAWPENGIRHSLGASGFEGSQRRTVQNKREIGLTGVGAWAAARLRKRAGRVTGFVPTGKACFPCPSKEGMGGARQRVPYVREIGGLPPLSGPG